MGLRDLFATKPDSMLHVARTRECNMQQMPVADATTGATSMQRECGNACVPMLSGATGRATSVQQDPKKHVARPEKQGTNSDHDATSIEGPDDLPQSIRADFRACMVVLRPDDEAPFMADLRDVMRDYGREYAVNWIKGWRVTLETVERVRA